MSRLFRRRAVVYVDTLKVDGLRVEFQAVKTVKKEPNTLDLKITNLSETTRAAMLAKGAKIILLAGYEDNVVQIFSGTARTIDHGRNGPDWSTRVQCGDGEQALRVPVSESFAANTPVSRILTKLVDLLPVGKGNSRAKIAEIRDTLTQGYAAHGSAAAEVDTLLRARGYEWSIQDGEVRILKIDAPSNDTAVLLSPSSGLIGSPEHATPDKKHGPSVLKARSLLNGALVPGGRVRIEAAAIRGDFRIQKVTHSGDTAGSDYYSDVEAIAIGG